MNFIDKLAKSWWVILSFITGINGLGFIYIGNKHSNHNWIIEGAIYEIPWFFYIIYLAIYGFPSITSTNPASNVLMIAELLMFVSIIRSIWLAIKLWNVYDNSEKYAQNPTELNNPNKVNANNNLSSNFSCCFCVVLIFFIFALIGIIL